KVDVSMNGIELQDREFLAAIREGREPNASVRQLLPCYRRLHELELSLATNGACTQQPRRPRSPHARRSRRLSERARLHEFESCVRRAAERASGTCAARSGARSRYRPFRYRGVIRLRP